MVNPRDISVVSPHPHDITVVSPHPCDITVIRPLRPHVTLSPGDTMAPCPLHSVSPHPGGRPQPPLPPPPPGH